MWTTSTLKHVQQKETNMQPSTRIKRKGRFFDLEPNAKSDVSFFLQRYLAKRTFSIEMNMSSRRKGLYCQTLHMIFQRDTVREKSCAVRSMLRLVNGIAAVHDFPPNDHTRSHTCFAHLRGGDI